MGLHQRVVCGERLELVWCRLELETGQFRDFGGDLDVEALLGVQALVMTMSDGCLVLSNVRATHRSNGCATLREEAKAWKHGLEACNPVCHLLHVSTELLSEGERCRILPTDDVRTIQRSTCNKKFIPDLQVSAANLDDMLKLLRLDVQRISEIS